MRPDQGLRYEASDLVARPVGLGLGLQLAILSLNSAVLLPTIVFRAADAEGFLLWAVFAGMLACGVMTAVQAVRPGRFGAGYQMLHGASSPFIAVCVVALVQGGPSVLATLVVVSGLVQAAFSERLALLHRILTPLVTGTVIMLLPVTVMPILACLPKLVAVIVAMPDAVVASAMAVIMATFFVVGMREVVSGTGSNPRNGLIAGLAVWVGIAVEFDVVFPDFFTNFAGGLFDNGMTAGGTIAILLAILTMPRVARFSGRLDVAELPGIGDFIRRFARRTGLEASAERMEAACEETLLMLLEPQGAGGSQADEPAHAQRALLVTAYWEAGHAVLQFKAAAAGQEELNLQDRLEWLGDEARAEPAETEISLRLLRHLASSVRRIARGQNPGRESANYLQGRTICVSCRCTGPCWTVPRERENLT